MATQAPGLGTGRAGEWKAGIEVEGATGGFAASGTAVLSFAGQLEYIGSFAVEAEATLDFFAFNYLLGEMQPMTGEAEMFTAGFFTNQGAFAVLAEADAIFFGEDVFFDFFAIEAEAIVGFAGVYTPPDEVGAFNIVAEAELHFFWSPELGTGSEVGGLPDPAEVGCIDDPSEVGGLPEPSEVDGLPEPDEVDCLPEPSEVVVETGVSGVTIK